MTPERKKLLSNKRIRRILILVMVAFFIIIGILSLLFYKYTLNNFVQSELMKLRGISNSIALQIDGDVHDKLMMKYKTKDGIFNNYDDSTYLKLHQLLLKNHDANMLKTPVYTLVKSMDEKFYEFGITSQEKPYFRHKYESFPLSLFEKYNTGGLIEPYKDEFGTWLSAFSPIKNSQGQNVAIVMVDEKLEIFLTASRILLMEALAAAIVIFSIMYFFLLYILRGILKRENDDKILLEESNAANENMRLQLQNANQQLSSINDLRKEMMANISHDLRTPLATIIGYIDVLRNSEKLDELNEKDYLNTVHSEAIRMKSMVADLFELTKLESGFFKLNKEAFNVAELLQDVAQKYAIKMKAKHIELKYNVDSDIQLVYGDIKYLERVLQNLMDNAVKFVFEGGFIMLSVINAGQRVKVKVCNNGEPISTGDQSKMFDRYYKETSEKGGAGLGLAIAKKILELHDNDIWVEVNENINTFWFFIDKYNHETTNEH